MYYFYWLPIGTDARVRGIPWATLGIMLANLLVFALLNASSGAESLAYRYAFKAGDPSIQTASPTKSNRGRATMASSRDTARLASTQSEKMARMPNRLGARRNEKAGKSE